MIHRRRAREVALQILFERDRNNSPMSPEASARFVSDRLLGDAESVAFATALAAGVEEHRPAIDGLLSSTAENWRLHRMTPVDRNVLRIAVYEMQHAAEILPPAIAIDEAIELARRYGTTDSPAFVNGILDKIAKAVPAEPVPAA
jgi:N utilization substance protein B